MSWDTELLPVPEIPYESDLYNDCEDAIVALLDADGYLMAHYDPSTEVVRTTYGDGLIQRIQARPITLNDAEELFQALSSDDVPAVFVHAQSKDADEGEEAETWWVPINALICVIQTAMDIQTLDNNTKRRLGEIERCMRQKAGMTSGGYWNDTDVLVGPSTIMIGTRADNAYQGVGWLQVTVKKSVLNRLEAV